MLLLRSEGKWVWSFSFEALVPEGASHYFSEHGERSLLSTWTAALGFDKEVRDLLGRWSPKGSDEYVRSARFTTMSASRKGWAQAAASAAVDRLRYFARNGPVDKDVQSTGSSSSPVLERSSSSSSSSSSTSSEPHGVQVAADFFKLPRLHQQQATRRDTGASIGLLAVGGNQGSTISTSSRCPTSHRPRATLEFVVPAGRRRGRDPCCRARRKIGGFFLNRGRERVMSQRTRWVISRLLEGSGREEGGREGVPRGHKMIAADLLLGCVDRTARLLGEPWLTWTFA